MSWQSCCNLTENIALPKNQTTKNMETPIKEIKGQEETVLPTKLWWQLLLGRLQGVKKQPLAESAQEGSILQFEVPNLMILNIGVEMNFSNIPNEVQNIQFIFMKPVENPWNCFIFIK